MKTYIFFTLLILQLSYGQNCKCDSLPELNEVISCKKKVFANKATVYRQFNCDSSWFVFENKKIKRVIFSLNGELIGLTERLGYQFYKEYKTTFIVENRLISGCCDPSEFLLFDKTTGKKVKELGGFLFNSETNRYPILIFIDQKHPNYLSIFNKKNSHVSKFILPKDRIGNSLKTGEELFVENLFEEGKIIKGIFQIEYRYKNTQSKKWKYDKIKIDLNKYGS